jgi:hypothetical protein
MWGLFKISHALEDKLCVHFTNQWQFKGGFLDFFYLCTLFNTASSAAPQIPNVSEDAGIEPRTVATLALAAYLLSNKYICTLYMIKLWVQ